MKAKLHIDLNDVISPVDDRLYSSFIEHMGRAIYTGIYEPGHPTAGADGFRKDVLDLVRPLSLSYIRYPGGNFLSGYRWKDGIGPKESRPVRPELAWFAVEPNQFGTDEFMKWCETAGVKPMLGVNLGTGTPQDAADLVEYVNGTLPTYYAELRRKNGHEEPYGVKLWCLGNEMDGDWQICAKTAEEYGRIACEAAKMMKWTDPTIELVACGSSNKDMATFGEWERTVLKHCYPYVDYLSLHSYYRDHDRDSASFLARSLEMEQFIRTVADICREAKEEQNGDHDIYLSFDEWNVWYHFGEDSEEPPKWTVGRPIEEENYNTLDALVVGCLMNTLIRSADVVKISCLAQLINVIAPITTVPGGEAFVRTIYWPFLYMSRYGRGLSLMPETETERYDCRIMKDVPYLDCSVTQNDGVVTAFLVNRAPEEMSVKVDINADGSRLIKQVTFHEGLKKPAELQHEAGATEMTLPAYSWNMVQYELL